MKKLLFTAVAAVLALGIEAAQCEGINKTGERCKREAAENSKFCIGHADQAKAPTGEKLKDDGTCWAVTEKGTRCKRRKVGESDYCALHAADRKPASSVKQCRALKWDGRQCEHAPQAGCYYCAQHARLGGCAPKPTAKQSADSKK